MRTTPAPCQASTALWLSVVLGLAACHEPSAGGLEPDAGPAGPPTPTGAASAPPSSGGPAGGPLSPDGGGPAGGGAGSAAGPQEGVVDPFPAPAPGFGAGAYNDGGALVFDQAPPVTPAVPPTQAGGSGSPPSADGGRGAPTPAREGGIVSDGGVQLCRPLLACGPEGSSCTSVGCIGSIRAVYRCMCRAGRYTCTSTSCADGGTP